MAIWPTLAAKKRADRKECAGWASFERETSLAGDPVLCVHQADKTLSPGQALPNPVWIPAEKVSPAAGVKPTAGDEKGENELNTVETPKTMSNK